MANLATDLARVMELLEKATPGPWHAMYRGNYGADAEGSVYDDSGEDIAGPEFTTAGEAPTIRGEVWHNDALALVAAVNFLRQHGPEIAETFKETPNE